MNSPASGSDPPPGSSAPFRSRMANALPVRLYRYYVIESIGIVRRGGFKELIRERGWRVVIAVAGYYLVRDVVLYVVIPFCAAKGLFGF